LDAAGVARPVEPPVPGREPPDPAQISRKLMMGLALLLALGSVYSGLFGAPKTMQMVLAAAATIALVSAMRR
jgi:hypothetical protein